MTVIQNHMTAFRPNLPRYICYTCCSARCEGDDKTDMCHSILTAPSYCLLLRSWKEGYGSHCHFPLRFLKEVIYWSDWRWLKWSNNFLNAIQLKEICKAIATRVSAQYAADDRTVGIRYVDLGDVLLSIDIFSACQRNLALRCLLQ